MQSPAGMFTLVFCLLVCVTCLELTAEGKLPFNTNQIYLINNKSHENQFFSNSEYCIVIVRFLRYNFHIVFTFEMTNNKLVIDFNLLCSKIKIKHVFLMFF